MSSRSSSPFSEGEILSGGEEKAIRSNTSQARSSTVNASARLPPRSSSRMSPSEAMFRLSTDPNFHFQDDEDDVRDRSPYRRDRSRSRSPYRANKPLRGDKRRHDDDHYSRKTHSDPRRFKVHYEDPNSRAPRPHADRELPQAPKDRFGRDGRKGRAQQPPQYPNRDRDRDRARDRSRSPFRHNKTSSVSQRTEELQDDGLERDRPAGRSGNTYKPVSNAESTSSLKERESSLKTLHGQSDTKVRMSLSQRSQAKTEREADKSTSKQEGAGESQPTASGEAEAQLSEAELIEQRRKKREAIKARHKNNPPLLVQALEQSMPSAPATPLHDTSRETSEQQSPPSSMGSPSTPHRDSPPGSPAAFAVNDDEELVERRDTDGVANEEDGPSAADYDPNLDTQEDRPDHKRLDLQAASSEIGHANEHPPEPEKAAKESKEIDMFAEDDDDDMFAPVDATAKLVAVSTKQARALDESMLDNWDYPDGHYRIILGELLDGRYAVQQQIGKGTFATVVRAQDTRTGNSVAVKIACNNETMYKAGQKEMDMLQLLNQNDADDKKHIIRLLRNFDHKGHLCLVFESLSADLREVLKKFGRNVGLNLKAIRSYAQQMFLSLSHLKKCQILHADLKPDNILVSEKRSLLKICDLGTAAFADDAEVTPYLVSRFYRAPEVILGMPFDYAIDMWSIGCTLFELYTGRILFAGADNNQMLRAIQECRGKFPIRMLKRSTLADKHFDIDGNFFSQERDKITGKATIRQINFNKTAPGKDLRSRLSGNTKGMKPEEVKEHATFVDLMDKCLQLDPARRITPSDALRHNFIAHSTSQTHVEKAAPAVKLAMNVQRRV